MPQRNSRPRRRNTPTPTVEITTSGRGGSIEYREAGETATFDWEFAAPPALALIFGPNAPVWDLNHPWAAGRQAEIFDIVGTEVIRQKAPGWGLDIDLDAGIITVIAKVHGERRPAAKRHQHTPAFERFMASVRPIWENWGDDETYDVAAVADMTPKERKEIVALLTGRDVTWREVEVLAVIKTPAARAAVDEASKAHLSIDTRIVAAVVMHEQKRLADLDGFLARQIRSLSRPAEGMTRTLDLAAGRPNEVVKQALLWASYNCTDCAPHCAKLLLTMNGATKEPFDADVQHMLGKLGIHNSYFDRKAAFDELCRLVGMKLDYEAAY